MVIGFALTRKDTTPSPTWSDATVAVKKTISKQKVTVHIAGAITYPGVYEVTENCRVLEALAAAGPILESANMDKLNLAKRVKDGQQLLIPFQKASKKSTKKTSKIAAIKGAIVSINLGTALQLSAINGFGKKKAQAIVEYRAIHGAFKSVEDIKNVKGIGAKLLKKATPYLTL